MNARRVIGWACLVAAVLCGPASSQTAGAPGASPPPPNFKVMGDPAIDERGFVSWMIDSPYQEGPNAVEVLCPDLAKKEKGTRFPVIYFLQVGPDFGAWGNPMIEVKKLDLHNKLGVIFVLPAFKKVKREEAAKHGGGPWYADHPTDPNIRHESYLVKAIVPFIEQHYPALAEPRGRLLLGFSMSGCGAFNLLLRHPDVFGKAAAWDSPSSWMWWKLPPGDKSMDFSYGPRLIAQNAAMLKAGGSRLAVLGYDVYRADAESVHKQLLSLGIPHDYDNDQRHKHGWNSGWLESAIGILLKANVVIFKTAEEARAHVQAMKLTGDRFEIAISSDFTFAGRPDTAGAGMTIVLDAILAQDFGPDGFQQCDGYRLYRYKPLK